jgi:hypothetical protein
MPPRRLVARTPPPPPPPALEPFPSLSQDEEELFDIAVRLDSALREFEARDGDVDTQFYVNCIIEELVSRFRLGSGWTNIWSADRCGGSLRIR